MSDKESRIIHGFGDRLAIDRAVKALGQARNSHQQDKLAQELAAKGKPVLNALLRHLEANDPTLRGGLGRLVQYMDPDLVIPALRDAAMDTSRSDAERLTAVMLLERYLDQEIDPAMAQRLPASYDVARESGEEAIAIAENEPLVLVEYAEQLLDEPPEIVQAVLQVIIGMSDPRRARLLMAIAAYCDDELQQDILNALGGIRHPLALQALNTLGHLVSPELQPLVRRQMQKLRLSGVREAAPGKLRALWSPTSAQGHSFLWFIHTQPDADTGDLLTLIIHDTLGVVYADAYPDIELAQLPPPAPLGVSHKVRLESGLQHLQMAEIAPELGLHLLHQALQIMSEQDFPWPSEIVVFGHWLWQGRELTPPPPPWPRLPKPAPELNEDAAKTLLNHPIFAGWAWDVPDLRFILQNARTDALKKNGSEHQQVINLLMNEANRALLSQRLQQQARWLTLTKENKAAKQTLAAQAAVDAADVTHPFIVILAWRSLLTAAANQAVRHTIKSFDASQD